MKGSMLALFIFISLLMLPTLACGGAAQLPDVDEVAQQAADTATKAASAAATAVVVGQQAIDTAATVAASDQAQNLAGTAEAAATALSNIELPDTSAIKAKFAEAQPDANGNITVTLTEAEMNEAIQIQQTAAEEAGQDTVVQSTAVAFRGGNIVFTGNITTPVTTQLTINFQPYIIGGVLQFDVVSATAGSINIPAVIVSFAETRLNSTLSDALSVLPSSFTLQDVAIGEGTMTITGQKQ